CPSKDPDCYAPLSPGSGASHALVGFTTAKLRQARPGASGVFKYRLRWADGSDAGEHEDSEAIRPHEILWLGGGRRLHVLEVAPRDEERSAFDGVLTVERADH